MKKILLVLLLLLIPIVMAVDYIPGDSVKAISIPYCYNNVALKIDAMNKTDVNGSAYNVTGCNVQNGNIWICACNKEFNQSTDIYIKTENTTYQSFGIYYEYYNVNYSNYSESLVESFKLKQTTQINKYVEKAAPVSNKVEWPPLERPDLILALIGTVVLIILGALLAIFYPIWNDPKNQIIYAQKEEKKPIVEKPKKAVKKEPELTEADVDRKLKEMMLND